MISCKTRVRLPSALGLATFLAALAGCGGGSLPPQASPEVARTALVRALEAWKNGESLDALTKGDAPLYFNDPKGRSDVKLLDYKLSDGHEFYGQSVQIAVVLSLKFPDGSTREKKASYLIDTSPVVVIVPG